MKTQRLSLAALVLTLASPFAVHAQTADTTGTYEKNHAELATLEKAGYWPIGAGDYPESLRAAQKRVDAAAPLAADRHANTATALLTANAQTSY